MFLCTCRMQLWQPCQKFLVKTLKTFCSNSGNDERKKIFQETYFSSKCSSEHVRRNFGKPGVALSPNIRKKLPNTKGVEVTIFWSIFFHQRWFFSNVECIFDKASKIFSIKIHRFAAQIPKTTKKNQELFERIIKFLIMFLCTCRMQLWQPCQNFLIKTLKTFCSNSGNDEKKINFPKNLVLLKMFVWTCTKKFWHDCRNFVAKNLKKFPGGQIRCSYNFFIRIYFHQKWFSSSG